MPYLPLRCERHSDMELKAASPSDIVTLAPNGGCTVPCGRRLPCGHACNQQCHSDEHHLATKCHEPCARLCSRGTHPCKKRCYLNCGTCRQRVQLDEPLLLPCGHTVASCECRQLDDVPSIRCKAVVAVTHSDCGHSTQTQCYQSKKPCTEPCDAALPCGHKCPKPCCTGAGRAHPRCLQACTKELACGHKCGAACHSDTGCPPCSAKCLLRCKHSSCGKPCGQPCVACIAPCEWQCSHLGRCELPCGAPCNRLPCDKRCEKKLPCGHQCPSVCGEECPDKKYCVECSATSELKGQVVDMEMLSTFEDYCTALSSSEPATAGAAAAGAAADAKDADEDDDDDDDDDAVDTSPLIVLPNCGHCFTMTTMDGVVDLKAFYSKQAGSSDWASASPVPATMSSMPTCPLCRTPVTGLRRYGRVLNKLRLDNLERCCLLQWRRQLTKTDALLAQAAQQALPSQGPRGVTASRPGEAPSMTVSDDLLSKLDAATTPAARAVLLLRAVAQVAPNEDSAVLSKLTHVGIGVAGVLAQCAKSPAKGLHDATLAAMATAANKVSTADVDATTVPVPDAGIGVQLMAHVLLVRLLSHAMGVAATYNRSSQRTTGSGTKLLAGMAQLLYATAEQQLEASLQLALRYQYMERFKLCRKQRADLRLRWIDHALSMQRSLRNVTREQLQQLLDDVGSELDQLEAGVDVTGGVSGGGAGGVSGGGAGGGAGATDGDQAAASDSCGGDASSEYLTRIKSLDQAANARVARLIAARRRASNRASSGRASHSGTSHSGGVAASGDDTMRALRSMLAQVQRRMRGPVYEEVSEAERRQVVAAMEAEFGGSLYGAAYGDVPRWFRCPRGHPFTIGECGGAMQVRCVCASLVPTHPHSHSHTHSYHWRKPGSNVSRVWGFYWW